MEGMKLLRAALPLLSSTSMSSLYSVQVVAGQPARLLVRTGEWGESLQEVQGAQVRGEHPAGEMTPRQAMLVAAVKLGLADGEGDWVSSSPSAAALLDPQCTSHGLTGRDKVLATKKKFFTDGVPGPCGRYYSLDTFTADTESRMVAFTYSCLIRGREGRGTEMVFFSPSFQATRVVSIRHKEAQPAWAAGQWAVE